MPQGSFIALMGGSRKEQHKQSPPEELSSDFPHREADNFFFHLFNKYLLRIYYKPSTELTDVGWAEKGTTAGMTAP